MSVYKVPQDVEAEDKFLGPLSFKQFLFFGGAAVCGYLVFITLTKNMWYFSIVFAVPLAIFGILAFPWSKEQPSELWLGAHIRFFFMKRKRIWDQSGMKELVTITAPKRIAHSLTDGLSQEEVRTRFTALASVIDSRGWAVKNLSSVAVGPMNDTSDRLVQGTVNASNSAVYPDEDVNSTTDVMDEKTNPIAQQFDSMINDSNTKHHNDTLAMIQEARQQTTTEQPMISPALARQLAPPQQLPPTDPGQATTLTMIEEARQQSLAGGSGNGAPGPAQQQTPPKQQPKTKADDLWFLKEAPAVSEPGLATFKTQAVVAPHQKAETTIGMGVPASQSTAINPEDEQKLLTKVHEHQKQEAEQLQHSHMRTIMPMSDQQPPAVSSDPATSPAQSASITPVDPAIIKLANNDDLNVETLARQAKRDKPDDGEVVITLR